jgi:hypothetical protein
MVIQHILSDRGGPNRTKQDPSRPQIVGLHAKIDDLADGGIAQQLIGNLDGDFHRGLGGALISIGLICVPPAILVLVVVVFLVVVVTVLIVTVLVVRNNATRFSALSAAKRQMSRILCAASISPIGHATPSSQISFRLPLSNHHIALPEAGL